MIFFPAIDLKDGKCVRLLRGDMEQATEFALEPAAQARAFVDQGCEWLHVVDLNGAFAGRPVNHDAVKSILGAIGHVPIELGGGIRDLETVDMWLDAGVRRVILGTIALTFPSLVKQACKKHPHQIAVGIDAKDGHVAVEGWAEVSEITALELARRFEDAGVGCIIYTDISRDGAMEGPNLEATLALADAISIPVILSGGVSSMDDVRQVKNLAEGRLEGVISGRAVYDGKVNVREAVQTLKSNGASERGL